jgi:uncharacterized protein (TIGR02452 family)
MNRNALSKVAQMNRDLVRDTNINIPKTIKIKYGDIKNVRNPITINSNGQSNIRVKFEYVKTDDCAIHYFKNKLAENIVVMNFASRHNHGGGYINGARAQEEDLCRVMPSLYSSLLKIQYPYESDSVLITPDVEIMRDNVRYNLLASLLIFCFLTLLFTFEDMYYLYAI